MEILNGPVDYTKPGFYWDGTTLWCVGSDGLGYTMGNSRPSFAWIEDVEPEPLQPNSPVEIIDAVARLAGVLK